MVKRTIVFVVLAVLLLSAVTGASALHVKKFYKYGVRITGKDVSSTATNNFAFVTKEGLIYALNMVVFPDRVQVISSDGSYLLHFSEAANADSKNIALNEYVVLTGPGYFTHILRYVGHDAANRQLTFQDPATGSREVTYGSTLTDNPQLIAIANLVVGGVTYMIIVDPSTGKLAIDQNADGVIDGKEAPIVDIGDNKITQQAVIQGTYSVRQMCIDPDKTSTYDMTKYEGAQLTQADRPDVFTPAKITFIGSNAVMETFKDECMNAPLADSLSEQFCDKDSNRGMQGVLHCPRGCKDGACVAAPAPQLVCTDTDGGNKPELFGTTTGVVAWWDPTPENVKPQPDYCSPVCEGSLAKAATGPCLVEFSCQSHPNKGGDAIYAGFNVHKCANGCKDGACVAAPAVACTDSDGGKKFDVSGRVTVSEGAITLASGADYCANADVGLGNKPGDLIEHFCDPAGGINSVFYTCPAGCKDGACVAETPTACKCGLNTFRADQPCSGEGTSSTAFAQCHDGTSKNFGGAGMCKNNKEWLADADAFCFSHCTTGCGNPYCKDSDGGENYDKSGAVTEISKYTNFKLNTFQDVCVDVPGSNLAEGVCVIKPEFGGMLLGSQKFYNCPNGCKDGACVAAPTVACTDSDGGKNPFIRGKTVGATYGGATGWIWGEDPNKCSARRDLTLNYAVHYDCCSDSAVNKYLNEAYCEGTAVTSTGIMCEFGCKDGACVQAPAPSAFAWMIIGKQSYDPATFVATPTGTQATFVSTCKKVCADVGLDAQPKCTGWDPNACRKTGTAQQLMSASPSCEETKWTSVIGLDSCCCGPTAATAIQPAPVPPAPARGGRRICRTSAFGRKKCITV